MPPRAGVRHAGGRAQRDLDPTDAEPAGHGVRGRRWRITVDVIQIRADEQLSTVDDLTRVRRAVGAELDEMQQRRASAQWMQGWTAMAEAAR